MTTTTTYRVTFDRWHAPEGCPLDGYTTGDYFAHIGADEGAEYATVEEAQAVCERLAAAADAHGVYPVCRPEAV